MKSTRTYQFEFNALQDASIKATRHNKVFFVGQNMISKEYYIMDSKPTENISFDLNGDGEMVDVPLFVNVIEVYPFEASEMTNKENGKV